MLSLLRPLALAALTLAPLPAAATPAFDTTHVRPNGEVCWRVPRGPDEWYSGPPYRIVCRQISRPAGLPGPVRR